MTPERWQEVTRIFHAALECDAAAREAFLDAACRHDPTLRPDIEGMLAAHQDAGSFGDKPLQAPAPAERLQPGALINTFRIEALIGTGGMGEVYRATDTKLGRSVALKVLPESVARDATRLTRLAREARALAALNHPNIAAIYGIEEAGDVRALVLELVDGMTLADALNRRAFSMAEVIAIARQIAEALEAAHEKGLVHRDLKPGNVVITQNQRVKVLDFGLAKATAADGAQSVTEITVSSEGMIVGTAAYMSPEQARGLSVDKRADIWAFGCVLYELLARTRAFSGKTTTDVLAAILEREPDWSRLPAATPPHVRRVLKRALQKDADQRLRDIGDARIDLADVDDDTPASPTSTRISWPMALVIGSVAGAIAIAVIAFNAIPGTNRRSEPALAEVFRQLTFRRGIIGMARFAADESTIVYSAAWDGMPSQTYAGSIDAPEARSLDVPSGTLFAVSQKNELAIKIGCTDIMFGACQGTLATAPLGGGAPRPLAKDVRFADWTPTGELALVRQSRGGDRLEFPVGRVVHEGGALLFPRVDRSGRRIAVASAPLGMGAILANPRAVDVGMTGRASLLVIDQDGTSRTIPGSWPWITGIDWSPSGDELWFSELRGRVGYVHAITMDGRQRQLLRVPGSVRLHDVGRDGSLLITQMSQRIVTMIKPADQDVERPYSWFDTGLISDLSEDGKWVLFNESGEAVAGKPTIYLRPVDGSTLPVRLGEGVGIALSSDASAVLSVVSGPSGQQLVVMPTGPGAPLVLSRGDVESYSSTYGSFFPGNKRILFHGRTRGGQLRAFIQDLPDGQPKPITPDLDNVSYGVISPDGHWAVGSTREPQGIRHMLYPVAGGDPRPIPGSRADEPPIQWSADGNELFVRTFRTFEPDGPPPASTVSRLSLRTGAQREWRTIRVSDSAGGGFPTGVMVTPDGTAFTYNYVQMLVDLYLVTGVK
jgi:serine/threonine protein kinase